MPATKLRLGYYMYTPAIGGAEQYLRDLLWELARDRYAITLFTDPWLKLDQFLGLDDCPPLRCWPIPVYEGDAVLRERTLESRTGLRWFAQTAQRAAGFGLRTCNRYMVAWAMFTRLKAALRAAPVDILHINNGGYPGSFSARLAALAAKAVGVPAVVMTVSSLPIKAPWYYQPEVALDPRIFTATDHFIVAAGAIQRGLTQTYQVDPAKISVIHYGVAPPVELPTSSDAESFRLEMGLPPEQLLIGMLARFAPEKGHHYLVQALTSIKATLKDRARVLLVGDGPNLNLIRAEVAAAGLDELVQFTGRLSSEAKTRAMSACDILVLPSLIEGLPYMITEALSYAKPVIASNVGGIPEQVLDGETGLLVPPRDALALANAIRSLVKDPNLVRRMGAGALQHYRQHFTLERMLDDHDALYQALYHSQRNKI